MVSIGRSLRRDKAAGSTDPNVQVYPRNVTYSGYFYFLWVPTLVYQISYPRNKTVRWG
jgi:sterol O-acyltransferase